MVEDEPLILMSAAACLEDAGHEVVTAEHGPDAVALLERWPARFTILVTDYHMPHRMTGAQLVEHMRQSYSGIPMLITTARTDVITAEFQSRHRIDMLAKPYDLDSLVATVGRLLSRYT